MGGRLVLKPSVQPGRNWAELEEATDLYTRGAIDFDEFISIQDTQAGDSTLHILRGVLLFVVSAAYDWIRARILRRPFLSNE